MEEYEVLEVDMDILEVLLQDSSGKPVPADLRGGYETLAKNWKPGQKIRAKLVRKPPMETPFFNGEVEEL